MTDSSFHDITSDEVQLLGALRIDEGLHDHLATTLAISYKGYDRTTDVTTLATGSVISLPTTISGDFSVVATFLSVPETGAVGLYITDGTNGVLYAIGDPAAITTAYTIVPDIPELDSVPIGLLIEYVGGVASYYYNLTTPEVWVPYETPPVTVIITDPETGEEWEETTHPPPPNVTGVTQTGILLDTAGTAGSAEIAQYRTFPGIWASSVTEEETLQFIGTPPVIPVDPLTPSEEAITHGLVAAQFGDLEYDVGKSVGWMQHFSDDLFVSDINMGEQRYWVVNWTKAFPYANYIFTGLNFFTDTENFREQQFLDAQDLAYQRPDLLAYEDSDWVLFIDAHEGLSADNRSLPDDYHVEPFKSFIFREIARANTAGRDRIVFPFFVFLRHAHVQNIQYDVPTILRDNTPGPPIVAQQACGVPYYTYANATSPGLTRMFKVSTLRNPAFDWSLIDTPVAIPDATVKMQIISYGYAHWNNQDIEPPATTVPPLAAVNDEGWKQRCLLSQALPVVGLPVGSADDPVGTWVAPASDPAGLRGPWALDTHASKVLNPVVPSPPPAIAAPVAGVLVPLYDLTFRLNLRDGVWYEGDALGNIPLTWNDTTQAWEPVVPPETWV